MCQTLTVNEICRTIQGEGARAGRPCALLRLTGCNLRCTWCDTTYAYEEGREMSLPQVIQKVARIGRRLVLVTGGEPLAQPATPALLAALCDADHEVLLQTNGSLDVSGADPRAARCVDVKCPGSGQADSVLWSNLEQLRDRDEVNFVLTGREDYEFACGVVRRYDLPSRCEVFLTPAAGRMDPAALAEWMLADGDLPEGVRLGVQLHKLLWPERRRGV